VIIVSKVFPATHPKKGRETKFIEHLCTDEKKHTIRANYALWEKRIDEVNKGIAKLSLREWEDKPYRSKQREIFACLKDEVGIQKIELTPLGWFIDDIDSDVKTKEIAENDGLSIEDFIDWFKNYPKEPMAVIHFTKFRYRNSSN
jgi:hypothetical protein